jgi:hypothetical protein
MQKRYCRLHTGTLQYPFCIAQCEWARHTKQGHFLAKDVKDYTLPVFTGKSKCPTPNDGGDEPGPSICPKCGRGGATEQLET